MLGEISMEVVYMHVLFSSRKPGAGPKRVASVQPTSQYIHVETKAMQGLNLFGEDSMMNRGRAFRYCSEEVHGQKQRYREDEAQAGDARREIIFF